MGEILIVASRLKSYIRRHAGYNTSDTVLPVLSDAIRKICDEAIRNARRAERQTVLDRDVPRD
jgi:histone H3/H4